MFYRGFGSVLLAMYPFLFCPVYGGCPSSDLTGDCKVNLEDLAVVASQWMEVYDTDDLAAMALEWLHAGATAPDIAWVSVSEFGMNIQMSKYETTNAQYCMFLNTALASGDIIVNGNAVYGASGTNTGDDFVGVVYYQLDGAGWDYNGATDGGAARIRYHDGVFTVEAAFERHPVTFVSWYGAMAFCDYYGMRLPTEGEWKAVANYTGSYTYGCGTTINNTKANYFNSYHPHGTTEVGMFGEYGYGMADMAGNVFEWTQNRSETNLSVICGGSWNLYSMYSMISYSTYYATDGMPHLGFRVCR